MWALNCGVPNEYLRKGAVGGQVRHAAATEGGPQQIERVDGVDVLGYEPQRGVRGNYSGVPEALDGPRPDPQPPRR